MSEKPAYDLTPEMRELLIQYNFKYFLDRDIGVNKYSQVDINLIHASKSKEDKKNLTALKANKKQTLLLLEGDVTKMVRGFLPSFFNMNETRKFSITRFEDFGENWSIFEIWSKYEKRKIYRKKTWDYITKTGAILAIILTVIKALEFFGIKTLD